MADDTDDSSSVVPFHSRDEIDALILRRRLEGTSLRAIGREFQLNSREVDEALDRALPQVDAAMRLRVFREDLEKLSQMEAWFTAEAKSGNDRAGGILIRIAERRAAMLGYDAPMRIDPVQQVKEIDTRTSTDKIEQALLRVIRERPAGSGTLADPYRDLSPADPDDSGDLDNPDGSPPAA